MPKAAQSTAPDPGAVLRFAEMFTAAVDRLGDPRPPLRIAALRTLELLGQHHPAHRQAIVDVFCSYLRQSPELDPATRSIAQEILAVHLRAGAAGGTFWPGVRIDLTRATLADLDLSGCRIDGGAGFAGAVFIGSARLRDTIFGAGADFHGARFADHAWLERATFASWARFDGVTFTADAWFGNATFAGRTTFAATDFAGHAWFGGCDFGAPLDLNSATFRRSAGFRGARVRDKANLTGTTFVGPARVSRRNDAWNLCPPGWRVEVDRDNESVGDLIWSGSPALTAGATDDLRR